LFWALFIWKAATAMTVFSRNERHRHGIAVLLRMSRRVSSQWFALIVINAFVAAITAFVLYLSSAFSIAQIILHFLIGLLTSVLHFGHMGWFGDMADWYGENQFRFTFWLLYSAAICDDLGLPNYKTLMRWMLRRARQRFHEVQNSSGT
jgi:hypothetical protein